jgi:hypothetical protein
MRKAEFKLYFLWTVNLIDEELSCYDCGERQTAITTAARDSGREMATSVFYCDRKTHCIPGSIVS